MTAVWRLSYDGNGLRGMIVATWGACAGSYVTALLLVPGLHGLCSQVATQHSNMPEIEALKLSTVVPWQQTLQKEIYLLSCILCPLLAWLSLKVRARVGNWRGIAAIVSFVPAITAVYSGVAQGAPSTVAFVIAGFSLSIPFLYVHKVATWTRKTAPSIVRPTLVCLTSARPALATEDASANTGTSSLKGRLRWGMTLFGLLVFFLMPWNINKFADAFTCQVHLSSFVIGPSLSMLRSGAVPGLDFESHYGLGPMYVFSYLLAESLHGTLCHYLWFLFIVLTFYHLTAYCVLGNLFRSDRAAFLATIVLVVVSMEGLTYSCPSNWPIRFPFLFLFIGAAARREWLGRSWVPAVVAGFLAGLSLFWQTDVGLFLFMAGTVFYLALSIRERRGWERMPIFVISFCSSFGLLAFMAFGPRTLSFLFYGRLLDPLLVYGTGFGFAAMRWEMGWPYLYNVVGPMVTLATIGFTLKRFRASEPQRSEARYLFLFAVCGMLMVFKWVNRSIDPVWSINAACIVVVLFWWTRCAATTWGEYLEARLGSQVFGNPRLHVRTLAACMVGGVLLVFAGVASLLPHPTLAPNLSSPFARVLTFTSETPTLAHRSLRLVMSLSPAQAVPTPADPRDIELIRTHTGPTEPVTLFADFDWVYLAEARRPPAFAWVPIFLTYTFPLLERAEQTLRHSELVFVERGSLERLRHDYPGLYQRAAPILDEEFTLVQTGKALDLYRRKTGTHARSHR